MRLISRTTLSITMRHLNSPAVLNSLENKIVEAVPADAKHVLVVNAGDGRLARAIREKCGDRTKLTVITIQPDLASAVDDFATRAENPWDLEWLAAQGAAHGAFDFLVFYQLHEFWRGELYELKRMLELAKPGAAVWASFLNAQANRMVARFLPPVRVGYSSLADPFRCVPNIDLASFLDFVGQVGDVTDLWGMLDQNAAEFCEKPLAQPVVWEYRGLKISIVTVADAFLWGATVTAVGFQLNGGVAAPSRPRISYSPYGASLLQALLLPYPDVQTREGMLAAARFEVSAWRRGALAGSVGELARFLAEHAGETDKPKRVLLVGCGWGRDLLLLKRHYPAWEWVGFDRNRELLDLGKEVIAGEKLTASAAGPDEAIPFSDQSFDLAVSLGYFSSLYEPAALRLAQEVCRVTRGTIYHIEDGRGPEHAMQLKSYSLPNVYAQAGASATAQPVLVSGKPSGMYLLKAAPKS
jgi:ubiquinone/menaquinone biosynthesis C-methylase UbiE